MTGSALSLTKTFNPACVLILTLAMERPHHPNHAMFVGKHGANTIIPGSQSIQHKQPPPVAVHNCYDADGTVESMLCLPDGGTDKWQW